MIEERYFEDQDYKDAKENELVHKNKIKEKVAELREIMAKINKNQDVATYDYNIKGEPLKVQVERLVKVYINGKEER